MKYGIIWFLASLAFGYFFIELLLIPNRAHGHLWAAFACLALGTACFDEAVTSFRALGGRA